MASGATVVMVCRNQSQWETALKIASFIFDVVRSIRVSFKTMGSGFTTSQNIKKNGSIIKNVKL